MTEFLCVILNINDCLQICRDKDGVDVEIEPFIICVFIVEYIQYSWLLYVWDNIALISINIGMTLAVITFYCWNSAFSLSRFGFIMQYVHISMLFLK